MQIALVHALDPLKLEGIAQIMAIVILFLEWAIGGDADSRSANWQLDFVFVE
jgi:hypothetical protein